MKAKLTILFICMAAACFLVAAGKSEKKIWAQSFLGQKASELHLEKWLSQVPD